MTQGFSSLLQGFSLLKRERRLWRYLLYPLLIGACTLIAILFWWREIWEVASSWIPSFDHLPVFAALLLLWLCRLLSALLILGASLLLSYSVVKISASPFNDLLSEEVERIDAGLHGEKLKLPPFFKAMFKALRVTIIQLLLFFLLLLPLWLLSVLLPGVGALIASLLLLLYSAFWLTYDAMSYAMDRRLWGLKERIVLMVKNPLASISFGLGCYVIMLIPLLNLIIFPLFVSGGTLLLRRLEESSSGSSPI